MPSSPAAAIGLGGGLRRIPSWKDARRRKLVETLQDMAVRARAARASSSLAGTPCLTSECGGGGGGGHSCAQVEPDMAEQAADATGGDDLNAALEWVEQQGGSAQPHLMVGVGGRERLGSGSSSGSASEEGSVRSTDSEGSSRKRLRVGLCCSPVPSALVAGSSTRTYTAAGWLAVRDMRLRACRYGTARRAATKASSMRSGRTMKTKGPSVCPHSTPCCW
jgi:hypothetical protein